MISEEHIIKMLREIIIIPYILFNLRAYMEQKKLTFMTNQKWKDYENDPKIEDLFNTLEKQKKQREKEEFQEWLQKDISYDGEEPIYIRNIISSMIDEISMMTDGNKTPIVNKKILRDIIASMLYKESKYGK